MATLTDTMTAEQLLAMPRGHGRLELVAGELRRMAPASHEHGRVAMNLSWRLGAHVAGNKLGAVFAAETGFLLSEKPDTVRAPDLAFVSSQRVESLCDQRGFFPGAPDLAVEVVSPSDSFTEVEEKVFEWLSSGALMVLVIDPRRRFVSVYRAGQDIRPLREADTLDLSSVVPGFSVPVGTLFE